MLSTGAGATSQYHWQHTQNERQRSHQNRTQTHTYRFHGGIHQSLTLCVKVLRKFDDQNGVLARQPDGSKQTYLEIHVIHFPRENGTAQLSYSAANARNTIRIDTAYKIPVCPLEAFSCSDNPVHS